MLFNRAKNFHFDSIEKSGANDNNAVKRYFSEVYPERSKNNIVFRRGEAQKICIIGKWIADLPISSVLDIGCGDGVLLAQILAKRIKLIRLEDFILKNIRRASVSLTPLADIIESDIIDVMKSSSPFRYDLVLAVGIFDYYPHWSDFLLKLLRRVGSYLILDFPRSYTLHAAVRRPWLAYHGIRLHTIGKHDLIRFLDGTRLYYEISETSINWLVKITKANELTEYG